MFYLFHFVFLSSVQQLEGDYEKQGRAIINELFMSFIFTVKERAFSFLRSRGEAKKGKTKALKSMLATRIYERRDRQNIPI